MKSLLIVFLVTIVNVYGDSYSFRGESRVLDTINLENYSYISLDELAMFNVDLIAKEDSFILKNQDLNIAIKRDSNQVQVNNLEVTLTNEVIISSEDDYIDLKFIAYVLGYSIEEGVIEKIEQSLPLEKNNFLVSKEAKTIVSLSPGVTEKIYEIAAFDLLIARTDFDTYPAKAKELPTIGNMFAPQIEKIIDMEPDIVIAETHFDRRVTERLREAGIEVYGIDYANKIDDILDFILDLGLITGNIYEARALNASLINRLDRADYVLSKVEGRASAYYVVGTGSVEYTAGKGTFISELISRAGGLNVADDVEGWVYSLERLIDHDPQFIFGSEYNINLMLNNSVYRGLSAIRDMGYFIVDEDIFNLSGPRLIKYGLRDLVERFHGEEVAKELNF